jgi:membrane-bound lytic murein transglycosylase D
MQVIIKRIITFVAVNMVACQITIAQSGNVLPGTSNIKHVTGNIFLSQSLPENFSFAGETVPLNKEIIREQWERELLYNGDFLNNIIYIIKLSGKYFPELEKLLDKEGLPDDMKYVCVAESNLQQLVSKRGAAGFWQFMPQTATLYGLEVNEYVDERFNFEKSTRAACNYLKSAYKLFGSWTAAAASYNCGQESFNRAADFQRTKNYYDLMLPDETNRYIFRILTFKYIMENATALGLPNEIELYKPLHYKEINITHSINNLADFAIENNISYKELIIYNSWIKGKTLPVKNGRTYTVLIPEKNSTVDTSSTQKN